MKSVAHLNLNGAARALNIRKISSPTGSAWNAAMVKATRKRLLQAGHDS
jgi:hypothetical protein